MLNSTEFKRETRSNANQDRRKPHAESCGVWSGGSEAAGRVEYGEGARPQSGTRRILERRSRP